MTNQGFFLQFKRQLAVQGVLVDPCNSYNLTFVLIFKIVITFCSSLASFNDSLLINLTQRGVNLANQSVPILDQSQCYKAGEVSTEEEKDQSEKLNSELMLESPVVPTYLCSQVSFKEAPEADVRITLIR